MEKVLLDGKELDVKVSVAGGKVKLEALLDTDKVDVAASVSISVDELLDQLKAKIAGSVDDAVIDLIKAALKAV